MKKIILILFAVILCVVCLASCNDANAPEDTTAVTTDGNVSPDSTTAGAPTGNETPGNTDSCAHEYTETVVTPALALKDGEKLKKCNKCGNEETEVIPMTKTLKILALGNSFTVDATRHLWGIAKDGGVENVVVGNLYIGSCTLDTHWSNISNDLSRYTYYKSTSAAKPTTTENYSVERALKDEDWDVFVFHQASISASKPETYTHFNEIIDYMLASHPDATVFYQSSWAYQHDSTHSGFHETYNGDQMYMYNKLLECTQQVAVPNERIEAIIPVGTSAQNLRTTYIGDTITRDGYHLNYGFGRYMAGLAWFAVITGGSIDNVDFIPEEYPDIAEKLPAIKESVKNALANPFEITESVEHKTN